jgi:hypothetical protein
MSTFQFRFKDQEGEIVSDDAYEFPDLIAAVHEAKQVLAEMALDGLPHDVGEAIWIEIVNSAGVAVVHLRLTLTIDYLAGGTPMATWERVCPSAQKNTLRRPSAIR